MAEEYTQALKETIIFAQENPTISSIMDIQEDGVHEAP